MASFHIATSGYTTTCMLFLLHWFSERIARFLLKNERFTHSLIFGERPEQFAHIVNFW